MSNLEDNLIKIITEAGWLKLKEHSSISMEVYQVCLSEIIRWAEECLGELRGE